MKTDCLLWRTSTLLTVAVLFVLAAAGCVSRRVANAAADAVGKKIVEQIFAPPIELAFLSAMFQQEHHRWPTNYAELCSFSEYTRSSDITNFDRIDFAPRPDGGLNMYAYQRGTTNRLFMSLGPNSTQQ